MTHTPKRPKLDPPHLAALHLSELHKAKQAYAVADAALVSLRAKVKVGELIALPAEDWLPEHLRGGKYELEDRGDAFAVGQTARRFRMKQSKSL